MKARSQEGVDLEAGKKVRKLSNAFAYSSAPSAIPISFRAPKPMNDAMSQHLNIAHEEISPPTPTIISLPSASLMDIIILQEISGKWKCESVIDICEMPADFQCSNARDMWTTLCVVVVIEAKYAAQVEEWELVIRKARKLLKKAEVSVEQYAEYVRSTIRG